MLIRHADPDDAAGCLEVYAPFADGTAISFEDHAPTLGEFQQRIERIARTHAFLVAEDGDRIAGFAYAGVHRERPAYRWSAEVSVYLGEDYRGRGLGRALYEPLFALLEEQGYRMLLAGISVPEPRQRGAAHRSLGFEEVGVYRRIGWKAGAWRDVVWLARQLGPDTFETRAAAVAGAAGQARGTDRALSGVGRGGPCRGHPSGQCCRRRGGPRSVLQRERLRMRTHAAGPALVRHHDVLYACVPKGRDPPTAAHSGPRRP